MGGFLVSFRKNQNLKGNDEMNEIKKVASMFEGLDANTIERKSLIECPFRVDDVLVECQILYTLNDGMHVELCLWDCNGMAFWDVSIDKKEFDESGNTDFKGYLSSKGVLLEDVEIRDGVTWQYCGTVENEEAYRIQYYEFFDWE
jgi:hypothetical protein